MGPWGRGVAAKPRTRKAVMRARRRQGLQGKYVPAEIREFLVNALESHGAMCVGVERTEVCWSGACCKCGRGRWLKIAA